ncbi:MAG: cation transport regulator [Planctomycetes bacterium GWF2_41_51]|nr:MAG: cation transport regulator [Planctomycetes bacterium GWF2_41_51]HBG27053.1 cation transport regulator [Phycisphaerales bacterium]
MPYKKKKDLPAKVKKALPKHAQDIYKETYNSSVERYKKPSKRRSKSQPKEQAAHRTAWGAVKKKYAKKKSGKWKAK